MIELKDVWKIYQIGHVKIPALRGLSLSIHSGEFIAIMGKSGSGKSTLMNMVGCLDIPTKGRVNLYGDDIASFTESDLAQTRGKKIGFIFQKFNLIPTLTAFENVMLPMIFQGIPFEERKKKAQSLLSMVGLSERSAHRPGELSGGEQQRVAIARSLAIDPEIILADEPTGNLDSKTGKMVMDLIIKLHKEQKKTIIIVTHDEDVAKYAQKIKVLRDGLVIGQKK
ncbi:ABC transporter ATP-binding protein [Candidatus Woesearchaeota archaeon]|nr:ABC transporter ATP-binding protein [Candidatus Woesearchaeota archaeon]